MPSVNKVILIGHCGKDPEVRHLQSGDAIANVSIATSERYKNKTTGVTEEQTEWHRIVFFGKVAGVVEQYVRKGDAIYIEGKLRTRKWADKNGIERYTTEILADTLKMLGSKQDSDNRQGGGADEYRRASGGSARPAPLQIPELQDDIPF